jgi:hypothetical protein
MPIPYPGREAWRCEAWRRRRPANPLPRLYQWRVRRHRHVRLLMPSPAVSYPAALLMEAMGGRFYAFLQKCECGVTYLLQTDSDRVRFRAHDNAAIRYTAICPEKSG